MDWFDSIWVFVLTFNCVVLLLVSVTWRQLQQKHLAQRRHLELLEQELKVHSASSIGVGQRIIDVETKQRELSRRQDEIEHQDPEQSNYHTAKRLVERGATTREVAEACGISLAEAELVVALVQLSAGTESA